MLKRVLTVEVIDDATHATVASLFYEMDFFLTSAHEIKHCCTLDGYAYFAI